VPQIFQRASSKDIISGIGITSLLFAGSIQIPIIGFCFTLFVPLPILFYRSKLGRKNALVVAGLSTGLIAVILGKISFDLFFFLDLVWN
jgi:hypothetical protein